MLTNIRIAVDPDVIELNKLIEERNKSKNSSSNVVILQQIQKLSDDIFVKFHEKNDPSRPNKEYNTFFSWYATNGIAQELKKAGCPEISGKRAEKSFMELSAAANSLPDKNSWVQSTSIRRAFIWTSRAEIYKKIDPLIDDANQKKAQVQPNDIDSVKQYHQSLQKLQNEILDTLNHNIPAEATPRYRGLLASVNKELNTVTENLPDLKSKYQEYETVSESLLGDVLYSGNEKKLIALAETLSSNTVKEFTSGDFTLRRLGAGGNNKNWVATNEETGQQFLVRLMAGEDFKPAIISKLHNTGSIESHFTKEYISSPLGQLETDVLSGNYVVSVSQFCSNGDLNSYLKEKTNDGMAVEERIDQVTNIGSQASTIINDLYKQGFAHPDIKAENFLIDMNGQVLISDLKFIRPMNNNQLPKGNDFNTSYGYGSPEWATAKSKTPINMDSYSTYQLGLMLYDLATGKSDEEKFNWIDTLDGENNPAETLDFSASVFQTEKGRQLATLIKQCVDKDPGKRPSLSAVNTQLQNLRKDKALSTEATQADSLESLKSTQQNIKDKLKCFKDADAEPAKDLTVDPDKIRHKM
jgi:serine/threonine protein kinase